MTIDGDRSDRSDSIPDHTIDEQMGPETVDTVFNCLAERRRRVLLQHVAERPSSVAVDVLAEHLVDGTTNPTNQQRSPDDLETVMIGLHHNHLPKLDEAGIIDFDTEAEKVQPGERFEIAVSLLEAI